MTILYPKSLPSIGQLARRYLVTRSRYRTEKAIRALPIELQKDIGWPESDDLRMQAQGFKALHIPIGSKNRSHFQRHTNSRSSHA
ncbi:hypothetical protein [Manganibacter manganicus]|uniref:hypothetical protein n=1 Tax=Manganibacter manganicus TaxID=1873176 RepID=UPI0009BA6874|nr:hypothetical protein [Pseudaminobacter manganicus]